MARDDADRIATSAERTFERTQGCWNCKHATSGKELWNRQRMTNLERARGLVEMFPEQGENHPKVVNIRKMVNLFDHAVAMREVFRCTNDRAANAKGESVGDLVAHNFLCGQWSAAQGASIARAGQKADDLPEELGDKLNDKPMTAVQVSDLISSQSLIRRK